MRRRYVIIMVMCASKGEAQRIADALLERRIVACANVIGGVRSKFRWRGGLDDANETLLMMKTAASNFKKAESIIKHMHSYEVPEIIAIPIAAGSKDYLGWIGESVDA